jgi:hypothetical protein
VSGSPFRVSQTLLRRNGSGSASQTLLDGKRQNGGVCGCVSTRVELVSTRVVRIADDMEGRRSSRLGQGVWKPVFRATGGLGKGAVVHCHICVSTAVGGHWKCIKIIIAHPPVCGNGLWRLWLKGESAGKKPKNPNWNFPFYFLFFIFKAKNRSKCGGQR